MALYHRRLCTVSQRVFTLYQKLGTWCFPIHSSQYIHSNTVVLFLFVCLFVCHFFLERTGWHQRQVFIPCIIMIRWEGNNMSFHTSKRTSIVIRFPVEFPLSVDLMPVFCVVRTVIPPSHVCPQRQKLAMLVERDKPTFEWNEIKYKYIHIFHQEIALIFTYIYRISRSSGANNRTRLKRRYVLIDLRQCRNSMHFCVVTLRREKLAHEKKNERYSDNFSFFFSFFFGFLTPIFLSRRFWKQKKIIYLYDTNFRISSRERGRCKGSFPLRSVLFALCHLRKKPSSI